MSSSLDPTISEQLKSSSDEAGTSEVEKDKLTLVVDDDANKSISQDPPHSSEVSQDPIHREADEKEVVEKENNQIDEEKLVELSQELDESIPAPEEKDGRKTRVADDDVSNSVSHLAQQSDDMTANADPVEDDKQRKVGDHDASRSVLRKQADEITPDMNQEDGSNADANKSVLPKQAVEITPDPNQEDVSNADDAKKSVLPKQAVEITPDIYQEDGSNADDANKSVLPKQAVEITPDPNQEDGVNAAGSTDQKVRKQLVAGESAILPSNDQNTTGETKPKTDTDDALILLVKRELEYIKETAKMLNVYGDICQQSLQGSDNKIQELDVSLTDAIDDKESDEVSREKRIRDVQKDIRIFKKHLRKLKLTIPPKFKVNKDDIPELKKYLSESTQNVKLYTSDNKQILGKLDLFKEKLNHEYRSAFKDFELRYKQLDYRMKLCLLCFSAIPEDEVIKKRLMVYWWIGEGFIFPENEEEKKQDLEQLGAKTFDDLLNKHFIYSADGKYSQEVDNCKMLPFVRWAVICLAQKAKFFEFDHDGSPTEDYSSCFRACLSGNGLDTQKAPDLEKLHMLLNVNEAILELKPEWLLKMRNISILCLGRWQAASEHHIEVEDTKFLQGLKNMIHLRYLSLQGISRITELPNSVSCLTKLTMLDLRACHNLEIIPRDIGLLKMLTYLDLSECYLLTQMPRGLSKLVNLVVLKGFLVVEDSKKEKICTLEDLTKLKKLRKLSIFTGVESFPGSKDLIAFRNFEVLNKLKIVWGGKKAITGQPITGETKGGGGAATGVSNVETSKDIARKLKSETQANVIAKSKKSSRKPVPEVLDSSKLGLPTKLQKLDLQCYPHETAPEWLKPKKLEELKKLYIRGGKLRHLNLTNDNWEVEPWNVETLRLKYLTGLGMNWTELLELFPKLVYLEKVRCTKLTLFPCNDKGVWINKAKLPKNQH